MLKESSSEPANQADQAESSLEGVDKAELDLVEDDDGKQEELDLVEDDDGKQEPKIVKAGVCLWMRWSDMGGFDKFRSITCKRNEEFYKGCCFLKCSNLTGVRDSVRIGPNKCTSKDKQPIDGDKSNDFPCGSFGRSADSRCCSRRRECLEKAGGTGEPDGAPDFLALSFMTRLSESCYPSCQKYWKGSSRLAGTSYCGKRCRQAAPEGVICVHNRFRPRDGQSFELQGRAFDNDMNLQMPPASPPHCFPRELFRSGDHLQVMRTSKKKPGVLVPGPNMTWVFESDARNTWDVILDQPRIGDDAIFFKRSEGSVMADQDWMGMVLADAPQLQLRDLCIPGSHDSGTYYLSGDYRRLMDRFAGLLTKITQTQDLSFMEQLSIGIRYFDLRVDSWRFTKPFRYDDLYLHHGGVRAVPLTEVLNEIDAFILAHPQEVLILDFQEIPAQPMASRLLHEVFNMQAKPVSVDEGFDLTIGRMWELQANLVLLWSKEDIDNNPNREENQYLWGWNTVSGSKGRRDGAVDSAWGRTLNARDLYSHVFDEGNRIERTNSFHVSQMILTPIPGELRWASVRRGLSIRELQDDLDLPSLVYQAEDLFRRDGRGVNVVMADFVQEHRLADVCIDLNQRHVQDAKILD